MTHRAVRAGLAALALSAAATALTACPNTTSATPTTQAPRPAGATPSSISKKVCSHEAQHDIGNALGLTAAVSTPTWEVDGHVYSCTYTYQAGSFALSVTELSSWPETLTYCNAQ